MGLSTMTGRSRAEVPDYRAIFDAVESTLIREGSRHLPEDQLHSRLDHFKQVEGKRFTDAEVYRLLVEIAFYSGFRAATVTDKLEVIHRHFPDYKTVAGYGENEVQLILGDPAMIRNRRKVQACVDNAQALQLIVRDHGAFHAYVDSFAPKESEGNLLRLRQELQRRFSYLGEITSYHFLMEIGMPVLKPDRVICRIFHRLGLIESTDHALEAIEQGRRFAEATGHPIRYIDIVFVAYGQARSKEFGLPTGICLPRHPKCAICGVRGYCTYDASSHISQPVMPVVRREARPQPVMVEGDPFVALPHGGSGSGFHASRLVQHIRSTGRDYIIQAQQQCTLQDHTKPQSLDVWLRENCTDRKDTKQAVNPVMDALVATGRFEIVDKLICPDSGRKCKGLRLITGSHTC